MQNIYEKIAHMRKGMKAIDCTRDEIESATKDVTSAESYDDAIERIQKYWR